VLYASVLCTVIEDDLERWEAVEVFVPSVVYASILCTVIEDDLERWEAVNVFVPSVVSCFCILEVRNACNVGMLFQELCREFSMPVLDYL
jgi:hypothetical protein